MKPQNVAILPDTVHEGDTLPPRDAMGNYLDDLLFQSIAALDASADTPQLDAGLRQELAQLRSEVQTLRANLRRRRLTAPDQLQDTPAMTWVMQERLNDIAQAGLTGAFQERCEGLSSRLTDPQKAKHALTELHAAVEVLEGQLTQPRDKPAT